MENFRNKKNELSFLSRGCIVTFQIPPLWIKISKLAILSTPPPTNIVWNHALSITTQRQVWATSLLSQIRQLYYALVAKEVVTESIDSRQKRKKGPNRSCAKERKGVNCRRCCEIVSYLLYRKKKKAIVHQRLDNWRIWEAIELTARRFWGDDISRYIR